MVVRVFEINRPLRILPAVPFDVLQDPAKAMLKDLRIQYAVEAGQDQAAHLLRMRLHPVKEVLIQRQYMIDRILCQDQPVGCRDLLLLLPQDDPASSAKLQDHMRLLRTSALHIRSAAQRTVRKRHPDIRRCQLLQHLF